MRINLFYNLFSFQILIFSQMTRMLDILEDYLSLNRHSYVRIDGSTKQDDRQKVCFLFYIHVFLEAY